VRKKSPEQTSTNPTKTPFEQHTDKVTETPRSNSTTTSYVKEPVAEQAAPIKRVGVKRLEPVFSGRARDEIRWNPSARFHRKRRRARFRRVVKKMFVLAGVGVLALYVGGVFVGFRMENELAKKEKKVEIKRN